MIYPSRTTPRWKKIIYNTNGIPIISEFSLGNGTMFTLISFKSHSRLFVGLERIGCFLFDMENWKSPKYVAEKLYLDDSLTDCRNIADWINVQLGKEVEEFGDYRYFEAELEFEGKTFPLNLAKYYGDMEPKYE